MADLLTIRLVLPAAVAVVDFLGLAVGAADFGAVYFQGSIAQAALGSALALPSHVPPASGEERSHPRLRNAHLLSGAKSRSNGRHKPEFTFGVAGLGDDSGTSCSVAPLVRHHHPVRLSAAENLALALSCEDT